jgi:hypothetical protein
MSTEIPNEKVKFAVEAWKTSIGVQQHFNTIEMQIRNIAVTVLTATVGAAALVYNQSQQAIIEALKTNSSIPPTITITIFNYNFSPADMIIFGGMFAWFAFYLMDRWWYHRLLQGAVSHAQDIENELKEDIPYGDLLGLSNAIRLASPFKLLGIFNISSDIKIDLFYGIILLILSIIMFFVF